MILFWKYTKQIACTRYYSKKFGVGVGAVHKATNKYIHLIKQSLKNLDNNFNNEVFCF